MTATTLITDLPPEIMIRIITVGCEDIPDLLQDYDSRHRSLKPFAKTASLVCQQWHTLVHDRSNYHFWITRISLSPAGCYLWDTVRIFSNSDLDMAQNISNFKDLLLKSRHSDLDLLLGIPGEDQILDQRLMIHAMGMLGPYKSQIRTIFIRSAPLQAIVSVLDTLRPLPRLAIFSLHFSSEDLISSPTYDALFCHDNAALDLSAEGDCREVSLANYGLHKQIILPNNIFSLTLRFDLSIAINWSGIASLLRAHPRLTYLSLRFVAPMNALASPPCYSDESGLPEVCMRSLRKLELHADISTIFALMTLFHLPSVTSLNLILDSTGLAIRKYITPSVAPPPILASLSSLTLTIYEQRWTVLHDRLIQAILPPSLQFVLLHFHEDAAKWTTSPRILGPICVPCLSLRFHHHQKNWEALVSILSRWDTEEMKLDSWHGEVLPRTNMSAKHEGNLMMPSLLSVSFLGTTADAFVAFLSRLKAPRLRRIRTLCPRIRWPQLEHSMVAAFEATAQQVRELELEFDSRFARIGITPCLMFFPDVTSISLDLKLYDNQGPVDVETLLRPLTNPDAVRRLARLDVNIEWLHFELKFRIPLDKLSTQDRRRTTEGALCHYLFAAVQSRMGGECSSLKAQLFLREKELLGLIWTSEPF